MAIMLEFTLRLAFDVALMFAVLVIRVTGWLLKAAMQIARQSWRTAVAMITVIVYSLTLPFVLLNRAVDRHRQRIDQDAPSYAAGYSGKPDWGRFADSL